MGNNQERKIKTGQELARIRANWWSWAYELRQTVKSLDDYHREQLRILSEMLPACKITVYGGPPHDWPPADAYRLAKQYRIDDIEWLNAWFITEEGWQSYVTAFNDLGEITGLSTPLSGQNGGVIQVLHRKDEFMPEMRSK